MTENTISGTIVPFEFEDQRVRVLDIDGEPYFVARDVAIALGYKDTINAVKLHCHGVAKHHPIVDSLGRTQEARVIAEADVMRLIVGSKLPSAVEFERRVFEDILPQIRRTGSYGAPVPALTGPALYLAAIEQATAEIHALETRNAELEPKAARFDDYLGAKGDYSFTSAAKVLQRDHQITLGGRKLIGLLTAWGWIYRSGKRGSIMPYQAQIDTKRLALRATTYMDQSTGEMVAGDPQTRVTPKGVHDIAERLTRTALAA